LIFLKIFRGVDEERFPSFRRSPASDVRRLDHETRCPPQRARTAAATGAVQRVSKGISGYGDLARWVVFDHRALMQSFSTSCVHRPGWRHAIVCRGVDLRFSGVPAAALVPPCQFLLRPVIHCLATRDPQNEMHFRPRRLFSVRAHIALRGEGGLSRGPIYTCSR